MAAKAHNQIIMPGKAMRCPGSAETELRHGCRRSQQFQRRLFSAVLVVAALSTLPALRWAFAGPEVSQRRSLVARHAEDAATAKLYTLEVGRTDHYVWKDKDVFVGIVADAGEWTIDIDAVRAGFDEACEAGTAELFSAPLNVIKDYVKELTSYGLAARAKEAADGAEESSYSRRSFKELSPELKEAARESGVVEAEASGKPMQIVLQKSDHPTLDGSKRAMQKFKAYVELATDAAQRWLPPDAELNQKRLEKLLTKAVCTLRQHGQTLARKAAPGRRAVPRLEVPLIMALHPKLLEDSRLCSRGLCRKPTGAGTDAVRSLQLRLQHVGRGKIWASDVETVACVARVNPDRISSLVRQLLEGEESDAANWRSMV
ncbi:hypothetical protein AK812_SmicGene29722 [Symbiodinium microadriaticum]|uniref:Uncharacterized protein n=2 Tax=Symbiodinium TaxID=2949 RepID=A0A1Q9D122_SYMMI|nr:hypothetical protein AK812_SmicGene29722 [Symbiodinium microadriaticum]